MAREAMTAAEAAVDREDLGAALVHTLRGMRLLDQAHSNRAPTIAQATTRELLKAVQARCHRPTMYSTLVQEKVIRLLELLPENSMLDEPDDKS